MTNDSSFADKVEAYYFGEVTRTLIIDYKRTHSEGITLRI
jgi:hypothetical protein